MTFCDGIGGACHDLTPFLGCDIMDTIATVAEQKACLFRFRNG